MGDLGQSSRIGGRTVNADRAAVFVDDALGDVVAWAVGDGIGDRPGAARLAADTAVRLAVGHRLGAVDALLAAGQLLRDHQERTGSEGNAVMVPGIARGEPDVYGHELAWGGDCRRYGLREGQLVQLTVEHTSAERARTREQFGDLDTAPDWLHQRTFRLEHILTTSAATATEIGTASATDQRTLLVLTSDGVQKPIPHDVLTELVIGTADPRQGRAPAHLRCRPTRQYRQRHPP